MRRSPRRSVSAHEDAWRRAAGVPGFSARTARGSERTGGGRRAWMREKMERAVERADSLTSAAVLASASEEGSIALRDSTR